MQVNRHTCLFPWNYLAEQTEKILEGKGNILPSKVVHLSGSNRPCRWIARKAGIQENSRNIASDFVSFYPNTCQLSYLPLTSTISPYFACSYSSARDGRSFKEDLNVTCVLSVSGSRASSLSATFFTCIVSTTSSSPALLYFYNRHVTNT